MGGSYEQVGDPGDITNVNPMTGDILNTLMGQLQAGGQGAEQLIASMGNFDFLNILSDPRLTGMIEGYAGERNLLADQAARKATQDISHTFAGTGLYSGGFGQAVGQGVGEARGRAAVDIEGQRLGLFGQAMGTAGQLQATGLSAGLGYYGGMGQTALGGLAGMGMPEYYEPFYGYEPGLLDYAIPAATTAAMLFI